MDTATHSDPHITSQAQFDTAFAPLQTLLLSTPESEGTWMELDAALSQLAGIIRGGGHRANSFMSAMESIADVLAPLITTERTKLSGTATDLVNCIAVYAGARFHSLLQTLVPPVIKITARTNRVFVMRATLALQAISAAMAPVSVDLLHHFVVNSAEKSKTTRVAVYEVMSKTWFGCESGTAGWNISALEQGHKEEMETMLLRGLEDADAKVRDWARKATLAWLRALSVERQQVFMDKVPSRLRKGLEKDLGLGETATKAAPAPFKRVPIRAKVMAERVASSPAVEDAFEKMLPDELTNRHPASKQESAKAIESGKAKPLATMNQVDTGSATLVSGSKHVRIPSNDLKQETTEASRRKHGELHHHRPLKEISIPEAFRFPAAVPVLRERTVQQEKPRATIASKSSRRPDVSLSTLNSAFASSAQSRASTALTHAEPTGVIRAKPSRASRKFSTTTRDLVKLMKRDESVGPSTQHPSEMKARRVETRKILSNKSTNLMHQVASSKSIKPTKIVLVPIKEDKTLAHKQGNARTARVSASRETKQVPHMADRKRKVDIPAMVVDKRVRPVSRTTLEKRAPSVQSRNNQENHVDDDNLSVASWKEKSLTGRARLYAPTAATLARQRARMEDTADNIRRR